LHGGNEFDIIRRALQMTPLRARARWRAVCRPPAWAVAALLFAAAAHAQIPSPTDTREPGTTRQDILRAVRDLQRAYGRDAVMLHATLLAQAIRSGAVTEVEIAAPGIEERDGKRFLAFHLDTGIVYNDREINAEARLAHLWTDIVEGTLRTFRALSVPADGVVFALRYSHKPYADEPDLRAHLHAPPPVVQAATFYLLLGDISERLSQHLSSQQLADRAVVLVDGSPAHVTVEATR